MNLPHLKFSMNPERQDVYWSAGRVIRWIDNVLEVQTCQDVLDDVGVVIDLANPLGRIGNRLAGASVVTNEIRYASCLQIGTAIA